MSVDVAPYITRELVEQTLDELAYQSDTQPNPLQHLFIVQERLSTYLVRVKDDARRFALHDLFVELIVSHFVAYRQLHAIPIPASEWSLAQYRTAILADVKIEKAEVLAWSILYHLYVRPELALTPVMYGEWMAVSPRNFRRYRRYAIRRLTDVLITREQAAAHAQRQRVLRMRLPFMMSQRLFGREHVLEGIVAGLSTHTPAHILITGASGIGKTALTSALCQRLINEHTLHDIIWLENPPTCEFVRAVIHERLIPTETPVTTREALTLPIHPVVIVVDGCERLSNSADELAALLQDCDRAICILTSAVRFTFIDSLWCIALHDLNRDDARELVKHAAPLDDNLQFSDDEAEALVAQIGGNPRALLIACQQLDVHDWLGVYRQINAALYQSLFDNLPDQARLLWTLLGIAPDHSAALHELDRWLSTRSADALSMLRQLHVIVYPSTQQGDQPYRLVDGAARFIMTEWGRGGAVDDAMQTVIARLNTVMIDQPLYVLSLIQRVLLSYEDRFELKQRLEWCERLAMKGILAGFASQWSVILEHIPGLFQRVSLHLAYCVCLRRLGKWDAAEAQLQMRLHDDSMAYAPAERIETLIEIGILCRYRGQYTLAHAMLARAHNAARRTTHLRARIAIEQARIALDRGQPHAVMSVLKDYPSGIDRDLLLTEAHAMLEQWSACQAILDSCIVNPEITPGQLASIHMVYGRMAHALNDHARALRYLTLSLMYAEQSGDMLTHARAQSNLGALYLNLNRTAKAQEMLNQAKHMLTSLKDRYALAVVDRNLLLLHSRIAQ